MKFQAIARQASLGGNLKHNFRADFILHILI